jgi:hypothetical protein
VNLHAMHGLLKFFFGLWGLFEGGEEDYAVVVEGVEVSSAGLSISEMNVASLKSTPFSLISTSPILSFRVGVGSVG